MKNSYILEILHTKTEIFISSIIFNVNVSVGLIYLGILYLKLFWVGYKNPFNDLFKKKKTIKNIK